MSAPLEEEDLYDVSLSDSSNGSIQKSPPPERIASIRPVAAMGLSPVPGTISEAGTFPTIEPDHPYTFSGVNPPENPFFNSGRSVSDEGDPSSRAGWTGQPPSVAQVASVAGGDSSLPKIPTYIHPISEGGRVTWNDHNDLVFREGKDRGERVAAPSLPRGYTSNGPLKSFPFDKLRGNNQRKVPLDRFQDEYLNKHDETPTELVSQIVSYYEQNEEEKLMYLMDKALKIQGLNDLIRIKELEYNTLKATVAEEKAAEKFNEERGDMATAQTQELKDQEEVITDLRRRIVDLEDKRFIAKDNENEEFIGTLMIRIAELEEIVNHRKEENSTLSQDRAQQETEIKSLMQGIQDRDNTIDNLSSTIEKLENARDALQQQQHSTTRLERARSIPIPPVKGMIAQVQAIRASLFESNARVLLAKAKRYLDDEEYNAAGKETGRAGDIILQQLPHLKFLHGRVIYMQGRAMYGSEFFVEAIREFRSAIEMGYDVDCPEIDGDCVRPWLAKALSALGQAESLGYPTGADLRPDD